MEEAVGDRFLQQTFLVLKDEPPPNVGSRDVCHGYNKMEVSAA
jgi:hypothetical protein